MWCDVDGNIDDKNDVNDDGDSNGYVVKIILKILFDDNLLMMIM